MAKALDVNENPTATRKPDQAQHSDRPKDEKLRGKHAQVNANSVEEGEPIHPDEAGERTPEHRQNAKL